MSCQRSLRLNWDTPRSVLSPFLLAVVVAVVRESDIECVFSELLYADDFVLLSEIVEALSNKF